MENIINLIQNNQLENALEIINEEIVNPVYLGSEKYHELFFARGIIRITKFETDKPLNDMLYQSAKEDFAHAQNAYLALHGKQCAKYDEAIIYSDRLFANLNTKIIKGSYQVNKSNMSWFKNIKP